MLDYHVCNDAFFVFQNDLDLFKDYLDTFLETYKELIDTEFTQLTEGG